MNDYMRALQQRFFRKPDVTALEQDIEHTRREVRDCLDQQQRRRLMHLVDTQNQLREEVTVKPGVAEEPRHRPWLRQNQVIRLLCILPVPGQE